MERTDRKKEYLQGQWLDDYTHRNRYHVRKEQISPLPTVQYIFGNGERGKGEESVYLQQ